VNGVGMIGRGMLSTRSTSSAAAAAVDPLVIPVELVSDTL